ncbi:MAG TPA: Wzz/FepE/Etk N-terminal domain-containing protein, partial [Trinickia sp.]|nr:Wzz/FepE/Etk N-terminal domain-containing protein [Trinickia sp.]
MNATSPPPLPAARVASDDIDLFGVLDSLIAHRRLVALTTATFAALAALHAFLSEPQYQADVMIQVDDGDNTWASRGLLGDVSSLFDLKSSTTAETQVFASRLVVSRAADALHAGIRVQPKRFPLIGRFVSSFAKGTYSPGLFGIGGYAWGAERAEIASFDVPAALAGMHFDLTVLGSGRYRISGDALDAPAVGKLGRLETFKTTDGPIALRVERFDAQPETRFSLVRDSEWETVKRIQGRLRVREQIKQSGVFVVTLRGSDPQEVSTLLNEIAKAYLRQNIERKSAEAGQSLKFIYEKLPVLKQQFDEAESRYTRLRATRGSVDATEEARLALQSTADAEAKLLDLQQRRAALSAHFTRSHPDSVVLDTQIAALERERNALRTKIDLMPELQQELSRLWLETHIARNLYTTLLT